MCLSPKSRMKATSFLEKVSYVRCPKVHTDTSRAKSDFGFFEQADRRRGVRCDAVPNELRPTIVEPELAHEVSGDDCAIYFEPVRAFALWSESDVMHQRRNGDDFGAVLGRIFSATRLEKIHDRVTWLNR